MNSDGVVPPFFSILDLEKSFNGKPVLTGVTFDVSEGETLVVLGGSGEGKTVLLRHLNGLLRADRGEVWVRGLRLNDLDEDQMIELRKEVAMVFQLGGLFDSLSVYENVAYPLREHTAWSEREISQRVGELLAAVELERNEKLYPAQLSVGMRKRAALARALALRPKAVLYDEPTSGLDPLATHKINLLIRGLQRRLGFTSVVVTHDLKSAFAVGDRFALLDEGKICFMGDREAVHRAESGLIKQFVDAAL
jgi:phospholipid/cholesterol/gamma-HCH transport system ATP-binding protein